ncbi:hypothetical protein SLA2020_351780 [Shorea laevis]
MSSEIGFKIGSSVGVVEEVDVVEEGVDWGEFLRVRINLDLSKPLSRGRMLKLLNNSVWVAFSMRSYQSFAFDAESFGMTLRAVCRREGGEQRGRLLRLNLVRG